MTQDNTLDPNLSKEAEAFDARLRERTSNNFVPDIQNAIDNDFFYKSFWRRKEYVDLYFGHLASSYVHILSQELNPNAVILDFGCGPGYFALELARAGFTVVGYDIAKEVVNTAQEYADQLDEASLSERLSYTSDFSSLTLKSFDAILCSGVLHHLTDLNQTLDQIIPLYKSKNDALLLFHEPYHQSWTDSDAFIVASLRFLLSKTGHWYEDLDISTEEEFSLFVSGVKEEYIFERDPSEKGGQSPNDLSCDFHIIKDVTLKHFKHLSTWPSRAFIYRCMGGVRATPQLEKQLAQALALIDTFGVASNALNPNYMYGLAKGLL